VSIYFVQRQSLTLTKQVDYFSTVCEDLKQQLGSSGAQNLLSKSLVAIVIGSNDIFGYFGSSDLRSKSTPQQYVDSMALALKQQLKVIIMKGFTFIFFLIKVFIKLLNLFFSNSYFFFLDN
jgi:hypothetical protein